LDDPSLKLPKINYGHNEKKLRERVYTLLDEHEKRNNLKPCLVHGDLWSGNQNTLSSGEPVI
jgi:fructosamine-3-kinase